MRRKAIVTGGTKGIGKAIVEMLLREGYDVTATYAHDALSAEKCAKEWRDISDGFEIMRCDQSDSGKVRLFTDRIKKAHTHIDCLVCNAGTTLRKSLTEMSDKEWERVMQVNVNSNVYMIRDLYECLVPTSEDRQHGSVVLIGSMMAVCPHGTSLAYGVTKSAVHALARNLVKCFEGKNVNVNAIAPGFVETEWQKDKPEEIRNNICEKTALKRFASVEEIADAVRFCVNNPYVNGSIIEVSGGYSYK